MGAQMSAAWEQAPAVSRSLVVLPLVLHGASLFFGPILQEVFGLSLGSVRQGRVWTMFTYVLWDPYQSLLSTAFALLVAFWVMTGVPTLERRVGSCRLLALVAITAVAISSIFLLLAQVLDLLWQASGWLSIWPRVSCIGLVPLAVAAVTAQCMSVPDSETQIFGIRMKSYIYPFVMVGLFSLFSGPAVLPDVAALFAGCMFCKGPLRLSMLVPSENTAMRWESGRACIFGRHLFGGQWVKVGESHGDLFAGAGSDGGLPMRQGYTVMGRSQTQGFGVVGNVATTGATEFRVFGGRGQRLGN
mmetsp:Transcript_118989/g.237205  ORF Transcript_118989/g.237205 Transcript_118989/m.237205 type:complete len:302 (+) Transcript_118989:70-975(+)